MRTLSLALQPQLTIPCSGLLSTVAPLYMAEISPAHIRGMILASEEFSIVFGIVVACYATLGCRYITGDWAFRTCFLLQMVPGAVLGALTGFLPESPRWLAARAARSERVAAAGAVTAASPDEQAHSHDAAIATVAKLRQRRVSHASVQAEYLEIRAQVELHEEIRRERHPRWLDGSARSDLMLELGAWADCFKQGCWKRTWIGILLMFFQQLVGINS